MRKFILIAAAALSAIAATAPASAQYRGGYDPRPAFGHGYGNGSDIIAQLRQIDQRIAQSFQRGRITRNEARRLSNETMRIENRFRDYRRGGLSQREHYDLQQRIRNLREQLREDRHDGPRNRY
jgi:Spy/CpxP family protein refolding chaperone